MPERGLDITGCKSHITLDLQFCSCHLGANALSHRVIVGHPLDDQVQGQ